MFHLKLLPCPRLTAGIALVDHSQCTTWYLKAPPLIISFVTHLKGMDRVWQIRQKKRSIENYCQVHYQMPETHHAAVKWKHHYSGEESLSQATSGCKTFTWGLQNLPSKRKKKKNPAPDYLRIEMLPPVILCRLWFWKLSNSKRHPNNPEANFEIYINK